MTYIIGDHNDSTFSSAGAYILNNLLGKNICKLNIKITIDELKMLSPIFNNYPQKIYNLNKITINKLFYNSIIEAHRNANHFYDVYIPYEFHIKTALAVANRFIHLIPIQYRKLLLKL